MKQLGIRLRALREGIGLSQSKFADVIGSTQSSINRYENGQATPTSSTQRTPSSTHHASMPTVGCSSLCSRLTTPSSQIP